MKFYLLIHFLIAAMVSTTMAQGHNSAERMKSFDLNKPATQSEAIDAKVTAEKYFTLYKPDLAKAITFFSSIQSLLSPRGQESIENRAKIAKAALNDKSKANDYQKAQKVLGAITPQSKLTMSEDCDFVALVLIESYFKSKLVKIQEDAWIFRMNLRQRAFPESEFAIIGDYLEAFPNGKVAKSKARSLENYLNSDYRPASGDGDIPLLNVAKLQKQIRTVLKE